MTSPAVNFDSASALLRSYLEQWGLSTMYGSVDDMLKGGDSGDLVLAKLRQTKEYQQRFAANVARQKQGKTPLSEAEYIANERSYAQVMRSFGLPAGFYDSPTDYQSFLENDVSPAEIRDRANEIANRFINAPQGVRDQWSRAGYTPADVIAMGLDANVAQPLVQTRLTAAQLAYEAARSYGQEDRLDLGKAEQYAREGVTVDAARRGFGDLAAREDRDIFLGKMYGFDVNRDNLEQEALLGRANTAREQALASERAAFQGNFMGAGQSGLNRSSGGNY